MGREGLVLAAGYSRHVVTCRQTQKRDWRMSMKCAEIRRLHADCWEPSLFNGFLHGWEAVSVLTLEPQTSCCY